MEQQIYNIIKKHAQVNNITGNMNLYHDLDVNVNMLKNICCTIEGTFNIPAGTFDYLFKFFDKISVSDLVKLTNREIQNLPQENNKNFFDILKMQTQRLSGFFQRHR